MGKILSGVGKIVDTAYLLDFARKGDVCWAVATDDFGNKYKTGRVWSFWMEGHPNEDKYPNGILPLGKYKCIKGGDDTTAMWEKIED